MVDSLYILFIYCVMTIKQIEGYSIYMNKLLGKGSYGSVYLGRKEQTSQQVAVKILPKEHIDHDDYLKAALKNQIQILQKLHSQNIVMFYDVMESSKNYYIIQELCDGDMCKDIKKGYHRPEKEAVEMLRQICNGFLALVKEGVIHRDLKPANVMKKGHLLKLGDFGFAKQMESKSQMVATMVGTPLYMSLEILKGESYTSKCDIWALGFIFYELLHGETPWTANTEVQLVRNIQKMPLSIKRKDLSHQTQDFISKSLKVRQVERISWDEIFAHPIFQGYFVTQTNTREFQNKLKMIMNKVRFYISRNNLNLQKILDQMGFTSHVTEITFHDFHSFLRQAYPEITVEQADYCFKKTDADNSNSISISELKHLLIQHGIKIDRQFEVMPRFQRKQTQTFDLISKQTSRKLQSCFHKLHKIITRNKLTLWKVFNDFDKKKGSLTLSDFALLIKKLCGNNMEISDEEIRMGFQLIDQDNSNSIQFGELNKYYSKINGIPMAGMGYQPMQVQHQGHQQPHYQGHNQSAPNIGGGNPFAMIGQHFAQNQGGYQQFHQNNNYQPGYQSQGQYNGGGYPPQPNNSFGGGGSGYGQSQPPYNPNPQFNPNQPPQYPPNQYPPNPPFNANQSQPNSHNPNVNPFDFLRK